jgi:benzoylformate decarboxylase
VALAERLRCAVYSPPLADRASFPEDHPLHQGALGMSVRAIGERLTGHDLVVVVGADVFRYYPHVPGEILPPGTELLHLTCDPAVAAAARVGDSLLGDTRMSIELLTEAVADGGDREPPEPKPRHRKPAPTPSGPPTPAEVYAALAEVRPEHAVFVNESTSTMAEHAAWLPAVEPESFYATPSGGIGWALPAAVGVALGDRDRGVRRPVVALIGDGSFQYSVQGLWTAVQQGLPVVYVAMRNGEYAILKSFADLEETPGVPGLDLPGLDIASVARGFGCRAAEVTSTAELAREFTAALEAGVASVVVVTTRPQKITF